MQKQQVITANKENCAVTRITCLDKSPLTYMAHSSQVPKTGKPVVPRLLLLPQEV